MRRLYRLPCGETSSRTMTRDQGRAVSAGIKGQDQRLVGILS